MDQGLRKRDISSKLVGATAQWAFLVLVMRAVSVVRARYYETNAINDMYFDRPR